jgi:hypothetical protein
MSGCLSPNLLAFCKTELVRWQLDQLTGGGGVPFLGSEYARRIRVLIPSSEVQSAVVEKLRDADRRRQASEQKARNLLASVDDVLLAELGIKPKPAPPNTIEGRIFRRALSEVTGGRLDPIANQEKRRILVEAIYSSSYSVYSLRQVVVMQKNLVDSIAPGDTYIGLENIEGESGEFIATADKESVSTAVQFQQGQILFPKLRPYLNKTHLATFGGICSTEFHVFAPLGVRAPSSASLRF